MTRQYKSINGAEFRVGCRVGSGPFLGVVREIGDDGGYPYVLVSWDEPILMDDDYKHRPCNSMVGLWVYPEVRR